MILNPSKYESMKKFKAGSIPASFNGYKSFYYESISYSYIEDIYSKHEWFRLYGTNRETDIKNAYAIKRKDRESLILVNHIPLPLSDYRLVEYMDTEYIVSASDSITSLGIIHTESFSADSSSGLSINNLGILNTNGDGIFVSNFDQFLVLNKGVHLIPENYVASNNYLVATDGLVKSYSTKINYLNKVFIIPDEVTVYVPIVKTKSIFDDAICSGYNSIYTLDTTSTEDQKKNALLTLLTTLETGIAPISKITNNAHLFSDVTTLTNKMYAGSNPEVIPYLERYLTLSNDIQRNYHIYEEDVYLMDRNNPWDIKINAPKLLIPIFNNENKTILLYMDGELITANPEIVRVGSGDFILLEVSEIYKKTLGDFDSSYILFRKWYQENRINHRFEIVLYDTCQVLEGKFTKYNDSFIPLPLDFFSSNMFLEVYVDGKYVPSDKIRTGLYGCSDFSANTFDIPVLYVGVSKNTTTRNIGCKYTLICRQDKTFRNTGGMTVAGNTTPFVYIGDVLTDIQFFYSNGSKINDDDILELTPGTFILLNTTVGSTVYFSYKSWKNNTVDYSSYTIRQLDMRTYLTSFSHLVKHVNAMKKTLPAISPLTIHTSTEFSAYIQYATLDFFLVNCGRPGYSSTSAYTLSSGNTLVFSGPTGASVSLTALGISNTLGTRSNMSKYVSATDLTVAASAIPGNISNKYLLYKSAYIYSLLNKSFMSMYNATRNMERLNGVDNTGNTTVVTKYLSVPASSDAIITYNTLFGKAITAASFTDATMLSKTYAFLMYNKLPFIPVPYGVYPEKWCMFNKEENSAVNTRMKSSVEASYSGTDYLKTIMMKYGSLYNCVYKA